MTRRDRDMKYTSSSTQTTAIINFIDPSSDIKKKIFESSRFREMAAIERYHDFQKPVYFNG